MQTMKHTEGLWGMYPDEWTNRATAIIAAPGAGENNRVIAYVGDTEDRENETAGDDYRDLDETDKGNALLLAAAPWYRVLALIAADRTGKSVIEHVRHQRREGSDTPAWCVSVRDKRWVWDGGGVDPFGVPVAPPEQMFLEIKQAVESL